MNPYQEIQQGEITVRTFKKDVQDDELVWHRDKEDREVRVVKGNGWRFQREDCLPILLREGDVIQIKKEEWHRIIKGNTDLIVEIKKMKITNEKIKKLIKDSLKKSLLEMPLRNLTVAQKNQDNLFNFSPSFPEDEASRSAFNPQLIF